MAGDFEVEMRRPRELLAPSLLLLLAEAPGHGYDLMERLKPLGFDWDGPGPIYRELRTLEAGGLVTSQWDVGASGPGRRVYDLTAAGHASLDRAVTGVVALQGLVAEYVARMRRLRASTAAPARRRTAPTAAQPAAGPPSPLRRLSGRSSKTA